MEINIYQLVMNPFTLMFTTVIFGLLFGQIKFGKFEFGASGGMFVGLIIGYFVQNFAQDIVNSGESANGYSIAQRLLSEGVINSYFLDTALTLFIASVALITAKDLAVILKKYGVKFIILGFSITFAGAATTYLATGIISSTNSFEVSGVYVGALTSSPGLGAALEAAGEHASMYASTYETQDDKVRAEILEVIDPTGALTIQNTTTLTKEQQSAFVTNATGSVGVGYAVAYPFGVIMVILGTNLLAKVFNIDIEEEKKLFRREMAQARQGSKAKEIPITNFSVISFCTVCLVGVFLGAIKVNFGWIGFISLGTTGGVLIAGLVLGYIGKIGPMSFRMDPKALSLIRELALSFFLSIVGLKYGNLALNAVMGSGLTLAMTALAVGFVAMTVGFVLGRFVFKINWVMLSGAICGGMTSAPGLGACIKAVDSDEPAMGYGATYPFALLGMILFTIVLNKLPIL
ncbi:MAG: hypothetical protein ATN36_01145 [Epulopiscium sp. Nele67-Bin005]|nr:MAG: hypothetical protein ATN36_01145 [Epulopiscium sp. Nele67-Bin005]